MWIRRLEYPRAQTYAIPYITPCFYAGSAIIIGLLIAVNIAIVGNDVVTTLRDSPYNSDDKWWAPKWLPSFMTIPTTPGPCQPFTLPQHSTSVRTNSTLPIFAYTVLNGLGKSQTNTTRWFDTLPYNSEPLRTCTVQNMTALINFQDRGIKVTSHIICDVISKNPDTPRLLKFSTTFSRMANTDLGPDDIIDYISSYAIPRSAAISDAQAVLLAADSPPVKMLGVLDAVGSDLLKATWAQKWRWKIAGDDNEWPDQAAVKWSYQANCSLAGNWTTHRCRNFGENVEGIDMWYSNTKGAQDFNATYFRDMNTTIYNYFTVMRDALHLDLGNIDKENNVFLSQEAFKARVLPDPFMNLTAPYVIGRRRPRPFNGTYTYDQFWRTCTWGWGCHNGTWTEAILNNASSAVNITNGLPIHALADQHSVVIDVKYVCPAFKVKQTGPLLVSVFIGTFSMYTALYGIFLFVAPRLDERYRKKHGLGRYSDDEEDYGRQYRFMYELYKSPPHSANPYYTVFDPYEQRRTSTESVPRYDPGHYPSYGRSLRKRAGSLPSGGGYFPAPAAQPDEPLLPTGNFHPISASRSRDSTSSAVPHGHGPPMLRTDSTLPGYFDPYLVTPGPPPSGARGPR